MDNSAFADYGFKDRPQPYWTASTASTDYPFWTAICSRRGHCGGQDRRHHRRLPFKAGKLRVVVLEAGRIGQGTTGHTTAKITSQHDLIYSKLIKHMGKEKAEPVCGCQRGRHRLYREAGPGETDRLRLFPAAGLCLYQRRQYIKQIEDEVEAAANLGINAAACRTAPAV